LGRAAVLGFGALMEDEGWLKAGVAGVLARKYAAHQRDLLEELAQLVEGALPAGQVRVVRRGPLFSREKRVVELHVDLGDFQYGLSGVEDGPIHASRAMLKRGIVLRTEQVPVEEWVVEVGATLEEYARQNQAAATAMRRFLGG
jgi:hypothetical protein